MKKIFLLLFIIILISSLFISCSPTVSPPTPTPSEGEGEGEAEPTGDRVVLNSSMPMAVPHPKSSIPLPNPLLNPTVPARSS